MAQALKGLEAANLSKSVSLTLTVLPTGPVTAALNIVNASALVAWAKSQTFINRLGSGHWRATAAAAPARLRVTSVQRRSAEYLAILVAVRAVLAGRYGSSRASSPISNAT